MSCRCSYRGRRLGSCTDTNIVAQWEEEVLTPARHAIGAERVAGLSFAGRAISGLPDSTRLCVLARAVPERSICTLLVIVVAAMFVFDCGCVASKFDRSNRSL